MHISNKLLAACYHKIKPYIHCLPLRACRTKAVFFVLIIYYWDFTLNRIACRSHTCITPDLNKSNEQVTHFLETVFEIYSRYYRDGAHGRIRYFSLWSDNCGEQFKNKFHFGWGSEFWRKHYLSGIFFNFFAPGHGKGICDSEGGINKHAVAHAALHGTRLLSPWDLYQYLSTHGVCVMSRTANALHSPEERRFHYFYEGVFLNYHPIDLKIDRINCFHSFAISKNEPLTLYSRNTSCFCDSCKNGNFLACLDFEFHGPWHTNVLETHVVISGSKTNSNFRRKTNLAGTSTVRVCNSASPRRAGWQIHNLQSRTAWKKKVAKASRVLAFEGMFIEQHTFLVIKSEIKQLFIFLCISYITLKLLLAEGLLIWTQRLFVLWNGLMNGLIRAKSPPNDTRFVSKLLCYVAMKAQ